MESKGKEDDVVPQKQKPSISQRKTPSRCPKTLSYGSSPNSELREMIYRLHPWKRAHWLQPRWNQRWYSHMIWRHSLVISFVPNANSVLTTCRQNFKMTSETYLKEKETQNSFARLLDIYSRGIWLWYIQASLINMVKQNRCLKPKNRQLMVVAILTPCSGNKCGCWVTVMQCGQHPCVLAHNP